MAKSVTIYKPNGDKVTLKEKMSMYPSVYGKGYIGNYRPRYNVLDDTEKTFTEYNRRDMCGMSRLLFSQMSLLSSTLDFKAELCIGSSYDFAYHGNDTKFKSAVEDFINNTWYQSCNVLGSGWDFKTSLKLFIAKSHIDGDLLNMFVRNRAGVIRNQVVESHRIGCRDGISIVPSGKLYAGAKVEDGVVKDRIGKPIGYYVLGATTDEDQVIPVRDCQLIFSPRHFDKARGIPAIFSSYLTALQIQEISEALLQTIKLESLLAMIETNKTGQPSPAHTSISDFDDSIPDSTVLQNPTPPRVEMVEGTTIRYIKHGDKIESFNSNRPAEATQKHITNMERQLLAPLGIPHEVLFSPGSVGGAAARGLSERVRSSVRETQNFIDKFAKGQVAVAIQNAIDLDILPATKDDFVRYINFTKPAQFTLDAGYERAADLNDYRMGFLSRDAYVAKYGGQGSMTLQKRTQEVIELHTAIADAKEALAAKGITVTDEQLHNDIQQIGNNPIPLPPEDTTATGA